jgi:hypothetical protein
LILSMTPAIAFLFVIRWHWSHEMAWSVNINKHLKKKIHLVLINNELYKNCYLTVFFQWILYRIEYGICCRSNRYLLVRRKSKWYKIGNKRQSRTKFKLVGGIFTSIGVVVWQ